MNTLAIWHEMLDSLDMSRLHEIIADDCVFHSPVVHTPQEGKDLTILYLSGAAAVFNDSFHYVKEVITDTHAVLEFSCDVEGIVVNGVDIMTFDDDGKIVEFKVMIRPLKGVNLMHQQMQAMLEQMRSK